MQQEPYHKLLLSQIQNLSDSGVELPADFKQVLQRVSESYATFESDQQSLENKFTQRTEQLIVSTSNAYSFLDSLHKGFMMTDTSGEIVISNTSVRKILASGNTAAMNLQWTLETINSMLQPSLELKEVIRTCLETGKSQEYDDINYGTQVLRLYVAPLINETSKDTRQQLGAVILVEDITEEKVLERSKDEFLSIASHELRTPLTAIRGNTQLIKTYYKDVITDKDLVEMINDIHESSVRLIGIVNDFLDVAAIEQGKMNMNPETFSLSDVIADVVRDLTHLCEDKNIHLFADESVPTTPNVTADKQRIKQVIYNLIGNSVKFTGQGSITISTRVSDELIYVVITDTGRGMDEENQRLLFRKFQQAGGSLLTRDTTKGTGLGLYISKLIVELSGGKIGLVNSEVNKGSTFSFSLPRAK